MGCPSDITKEQFESIRPILGGEPFRTAVKELIVANVEIAKRNELHKFVMMPKRWVVERSFSWLEKCHRLWKN